MNFDPPAVLTLAASPDASIAPSERGPTLIRNHCASLACLLRSSSDRRLAAASLGRVRQQRRLPAATAATSSLGHAQRLRLDVPEDLQRGRDRRASHEAAPEHHVNYGGGGSGKGKSDLQTKTVDFAGTDSL